MNYPDAIAYIASLEPRGWRLGLDRMEEFVRRAGLADALGGPGGPQFIHIAGTNGKGSTTAYAQSLLIEHGFNTGAFFSPFVVDPRERIQLNRDLISPDDLARLTTWLKPIAESLSETEFGGVTEFEFKAALGFLFWKRSRCDWVALEVGLGGRLDATNVITPRCSIITSISLDHTSILGGTVAEIAREKGGIVKEGIPVVVGDLPDEAFEVIDKIARERSACLVPRRHFPMPQYGIRGIRQAQNFDLAATALIAAGLELDEERLVLAARNAQIPGRFQIERIQGVDVVFDGAHNAESAQVLAESLTTDFPRRRWILVTNVVRGHGVPEFYLPLAPHSRSVKVVPIDSVRARPPAETASEIPGAVPLESLASGLEAAFEEATSDDVVVVTGSFYLVGEALRLLATDIGNPE